MGKVETVFLGKSIEDGIHQTLVTLSKERARYQELERRGVSSLVPAWLESSIYRLELALADLEGSRIAAGTLRVTVEELLEIVDYEHGGGCQASARIRERWETLLRRSDEGQG